MINLIKNQHSLKNYSEFLLGLQLRQKQILNTFFHLDHEYNGTIYISQRKLASLLGVTREWVNKLIARLIEYKLITTIDNPDFWKPNHYKLSPIFSNPLLCKAIWKSFKSLYIPIAFLTLVEVAPEALSKKEFTHIKDIYINKPTWYRNTAYQVDYRDQNSGSGWDRKEKNGEFSMKTTISPAILAIKSLSLTIRGKIELSPFPDPVIQKTDWEVGLTKTIVAHPIGYFRSVAIRISKEMGIIPDWSAIPRLLSELNIPFSEPFLTQPGINKASEASANSLKQEGVKKYAPWKDTDLRFKEGCTLDHTKELADFFSEKGVQGLQNLCRIIGEDAAKGFYTRIITNHEDCLKTNHGV